MAEVTWTMKAYTRTGAGLTAASFDPDLAVSNEIRHAFNRNLSLYLNGVDQLKFSLLLDDPMALNFKRGRTFVKLWRSVNDTANSKTFTPAANLPTFAGIVTNTVKNGEENSMEITVFSPLWRLQSRFHRFNHYLAIDPTTSAAWKQSRLMWYLIELINNVIPGGNPRTGIVQGTFGWAGEPTMAPYFVARGSNTWANVFDTVMNRAAGPDIVPRYTHTDGSQNLMYFDTEQKRGDDVSATTQFNFHTNPAANHYGAGITLTPNASNVVETEMIVPGEFANYMWTVGHGGPNSGKIVVRQNSSEDADSDGYQEIGIYMARVDKPDEQRLSTLIPHADREWLRKKVIKPLLEVTLPPSTPIYYQTDFELGDVVGVNADKGALKVGVPRGDAFPGRKQRIYEVTLSMSDNNMETATPLVSDDFFGKVAT